MNHLQYQFLRELNESEREKDKKSEMMLEGCLLSSFFNREGQEDKK